MQNKTLLPPNAFREEVAFEQNNAERIEALPVPMRKIRSAALVPVAFIPWLAWDRGVTWWENDWPVIQKRQVILAATGINKRRGTAGAVRRALAALDFPVDVIEWFQDSPKAAPYTFRLVVHARTVQGDIDKITAMVMDAKNVRSYLAGIDVIPPAVSGKYYIAGASAGTIYSSVGARV